MTTYISAEQTAINPPSFGQPLYNRVKANKFGGRLRFAEFMFVVPAGTLAIADKIVWGKLPVGSRIIGHLSKLVFTAGTASSTINVGDNVVPARHLAATSVAGAGSAVPSAAEQACVSTATTVNGSNILTVTASLGAPQIGSLVSGTGIASNTVVTAISYNSAGTATVTMSAAATASGSVTITFTGGAYETKDDTNSPSNNYASATDDCTLTSVVAGAVLAAGQVLTLKVAYVND